MRKIAALTCLCAVAVQAQARTVPERLGVEIPVTPADMVSGGDIRVLVDDRGRLDSKDVLLRLNGQPTNVPLSRWGDKLTGVVTGLKTGQNRISAEAKGFASGSIDATNHARGGPIFSGSQLQPWICAAITARPATESAAARDANGLASDPVDAQCNAPSKFSLYYRTTQTNCEQPIGKANSCFKPYIEGTARPEDLAATRLLDGRTVDYIVRVERGAINRGLYDIAMLYDPDAPSDARMGAWNHKIVWVFGGSGGNMRRQVAPASSWANDEALSQGFIVGVSNFTDGSRNNNPVLAAETLMMLREHVSDTYGPVGHLIGEGCSAGSMQQFEIATMYPGLIDGAMVACAFPDRESVRLEILDSFLLKRYFDSETFKNLTAGLSEDDVIRRRAAIAGNKDEKTAISWGRFLRGYLPGNSGPAPSSNDCELPNSLVYDEERNPGGVRCATPDGSVAIWGTYPGTKVARLVRDNVGVQYGLQALLANVIGAEEFVVLNEQIGGLDRDGEMVKDRMTGDREALAIAYRSGVISNGASLAAIPIIDLRGEENSGVHTNWHSLAIRERLQQASGGRADNYAVWRVGINGTPWNSPKWKVTGLGLESLRVMDKWLDGVGADTKGSRAERIRRNRPADLKSFCYLGTNYTERVLDEARCDKDPTLHYYRSTRQAAGAPIANNILKCELRPLKASDYRGLLDTAQLSRLRQVFPGGVCDWSKPGVGQQAPRPWSKY